eukprot:gene19938-25903_t
MMITSKSTVIQEEAIDELAIFKGVGEQVAELTKGAMGGNVSFNDALRNRLNLIKPSNKDIKTFMTTKKLQLTPGIRQLSRRLQAKGVHVYLVSGGFRQMIYPIAKVVAVPHHRIYANNILFHSNGDYESFDSNELTSKDGGKALVIQRLKDLFHYETIVMIGDGVTDLHARPPADLFIGFGGVIVRDKVKESADWFITDFQKFESIDLSGVIELNVGGIPPIPYPSFKFMSAGAYGYYMGKLRPLLEYDDLKPKVYQMFREIGNTIGFYMDLSTLLDIKHCYEFNQLAPFL